MPRAKKKVEIKPIKTREQMERVVGEICALLIREEEITVRMKEEIMRIREQHEREMSSIKVDLAARLDAAETWAGENAADFAGKKSIVMVHGTVGYRTGKPRLKTLRGWTWDRVLGVLETAFPEYVRVKKTVDKERLLADQDKLGPDRMRRVGCTTVQDETFFVEPHRESSEEAA